MPTWLNSDRRVFTLPGLRHQTLAARDDGLAHLEVWAQVLSPGAETPAHYHECEEVVVIQTGRGRLIMDSQSIAFGPGTTLTLAPRLVHQIVNCGDSEMNLIAVFSETPARVFAPDGSLIALPWQTAAT